VLSPEALRERLDRRLPALGSGSRDLPERHKTLRNAIRWSYELLSDQEQVVFRRLAVFAGGWSLPAAEAVLGNDHETDLLDTLESLAAQSLIRAEPGEHDEPRFSMLETIREFALEQLAEAGEERRIREMHADYFLQMTEDSESSLFGKDQRVTLAELDREYGNVRAALSLFSRLKRADPMLRISVVIWNYWETRGFGEEGQQWVRKALEMEAFSDPKVLINALNRVGNLTIDLGDIDGAGAYFERSLRLAMRHRDRQMIARNLCSLGLIANLQGRYDDESRLLSRGLELSQRLGDTRGIALATLNLAISARESGDAQRALPLFEEAYRLREALEDEDGLAWTAFYFGLLHRDLDSTDQAERSFSQSLAAFRSLGNIVGVAYAQYGLGLIALDRKEFETAETNIIEAAESHKLRHDLPATAECLEALAMLSAAKLEFERAAELLGTAAAFREQSGVPVRNADQARHQTLIAEVKTPLGSQVFEAHFEAGSHAHLRESMSLQHMIS
jgi:tetratricopeptide (TPR) repeat protein